MNEFIFTATGRMVEIDYLAAIAEPPRIYIRATNISIAEAATVFSNSVETRVIRHGNDDYIGFSRLVFVSPEAGAIKISLAKE